MLVITTSCISFQQHKLETGEYLEKKMVRDQRRKPNGAQENESHIEKEGVHQSGSPPATQVHSIDKLSKTAEITNHRIDDKIYKRKKRGLHPQELLLHGMNCNENQSQAQHHCPSYDCKQKIEAEESKCNSTKKTWQSRRNTFKGKVTT